MLTLEERPIPVARPGWVVGRVRAFGLNRAELITRRGGSGDAVKFPRVIGIECAGEVVETAGEIGDAHRYMEANRATGKLVVLTRDD